MHTIYTILIAERMAGERKNTHTYQDTFRWFSVKVL